LIFKGFIQEVALSLLEEPAVPSGEDYREKETA
jgi:hypothetical protein